LKGEKPYAFALVWTKTHTVFPPLQGDRILFIKYLGYRDVMTATLGDLLGDRASHTRFAPVHDESGIGAAIIAAVASIGRDGKAG
jgi:hexokinase